MPSSNTDQMKASWQTGCYTTTELEHVLMLSYRCLLPAFFRLRTRACVLFSPPADQTDTGCTSSGGRSRRQINKAAHSSGLAQP